MCIVPKDIDLPVGYILAARKLGNRDGAGVMFTENQRVCISKVLGKTDDEVRELYESHAHRTMAWHVRNQSVGPVTLENCHPYWVLNKDWGHKCDIAMMHNGTIRNVQVDPYLSDSNNFASYFLRPVLLKNPKLYMSNELWRLVSALLGPNKLILLDNLERFIVVNAGLGRMLQPFNIWVSSDTRLSPVDVRESSLTTLASSPGRNPFRSVAIRGMWVPDVDGKQHYRTEPKQLTLEDVAGMDRQQLRELVRQFPELATDFLSAAMEIRNRARD